jgi:hypothetical protein
MGCLGWLECQGTLGCGGNCTANSTDAGWPFQPPYPTPLADRGAFHARYDMASADGVGSVAGLRGVIGSAAPC